MDNNDNSIPLAEETPSRFVVGIDLGTTNSAVTFVDTAEELWDVRPFPIRQFVAPGQIEARRALPSFYYQPARDEFNADQLKLPWRHKNSNNAIVGVLARDHGMLTPGRLIASAKSWLCHTGVNRTANLLPWHAARDVNRMSPVDVSASYLRHIRQAWDAEHPENRLGDQDIALTLPASFDEIARELTVEAAKAAGLDRVVLIEEPQAAFYAWLHRNCSNWRKLVAPGQKILVCDVGGGTSDFTLIQVRRSENDKIAFHRIAVGQHLILGGDNLDLTLAQYLEPRFGQGNKLDPRRWSTLVRACRNVKETLLSENAPASLNVNLPSRGSRLIGGGQTAEVTKEEIEEVLVDGFLPRVALDDKPRQLASGFQEFGLPFAPDAAITRYLAAFLTAHREVSVEQPMTGQGHDPALPDIVLLNGGFFQSPLLRDRLLDVLRSWFPEPESSRQNASPMVLKGDDLDLAVARGAAYYGMVRRGEGIRIASQLARTYYIGLQSEEPTALCVVPASADPGKEVEVPDRTFQVQVSKPVQFPLFVSSTRLTDKPGQLVSVDHEQMNPIPPIRTVLRKRKRSDSDVADVKLHAQLTEIGTIDLWCTVDNGDQSWRLQFDVRSAVATDVEAHPSQGEAEGFIDEHMWDGCYHAVNSTFGPSGTSKPRQLFPTLESATDMARAQWPMSLLRRIWDSLLQLESGRRRSDAHEARWLNLLGYALRPGYGFALDDWRVAESWRIVQGKVFHHTPTCRNESWILWRRLAGGLHAGQQQAIAEPLLAPIRALHRRVTTGKTRGGEVVYNASESVELWRLLGSLELLPLRSKIELGDKILDLLGRPKLQPSRAAMAWTLGRLGARVPVYGPLNTVLPAETISHWLSSLMAHRAADPADLLAVMQISRRTDDRYRDLPDGDQHDAIAWLQTHDAPPHYIELVQSSGNLNADDQGRVFGESLPVGLRIA